MRHLCAVDGSVVALLRQPIPSEGLGQSKSRQLIGDLLNPDSYRIELAGCSAVVHLAAVTGRAPPGVYEQVNVEGTRLLLQACKAAGVRRILYVSTIAAGYMDQRYYPYARSKAKAEQLVRESGLDYAIVRPTVVLGQRSPIWNTLLKIAKQSVVPLPQGSRPVRIQPIHVDDVARGIALLLEVGRFEGEVLALGGPRSLTFVEFLGLVQVALRGKAGRVVRVPLWPIRTVLAVMEPVLRPLLPVTAGQLALFANDSVAEDNWLLARLRAEMPSTETTIADLIDAERAGANGPTGAVPKHPAQLLSEGDRRALEAECSIFTAYLINAEPSSYVRDQYARAAFARGLAFYEDFSRFDRITLALAGKSRVLASCADAYCALFRPRGTLRRKLILLAAILEHVAPTNEAFDQPSQQPVALAVLLLLAHGLIFAASLLLGAAVLAPASVLCWIANLRDGAGVRMRRVE
jgi:NADH dehydrogenase